MRWRDDGRAALRPLLAGGWLALCELVWLRTSADALFLSDAERWRAAAAVATTNVSACVVAWALGSAVVRLSGAVGGEPDPDRRRRGARRLGLLAAVVVAPLVAGLLAGATEGGRFRALPGRSVVLVLTAGAAAIGAALLVARLVRWLRDPRARVPRGALAVCGLAALLLVWADGAVLPRLYPTVHAALGLGALLAVLFGALLVPFRPRRTLVVETVFLAFAIGAVAGWPQALRDLRAASNASFVVERHAPLTGKLLTAWRRTGGPTLGGGAHPPSPPAPARSGIDLRAADVLVITVDALRADRLSAYGHSGSLTPHMDDLAREGAIFRRAYTPTPHTSYAVASLWTGKFMRPVLELDGARADHPTVAGMLRRRGYQTAAFYPPALFAVDGGRFGALRAKGLGFEHREESFAPAPERVRQLADYLAGAAADRPVLAWVHLFEPHEPYDPPPGVGGGEGDGPEARYDAEVAVADAAVGELVRLFREARPDATVVLTSDHGEEHGDHGGYYHGTTLYDEQVRVPLLWSSPGVVEPATVEGPVEIVDVGPTLLTALGVAPDPRMRGDDLGPVLAGEHGAGPLHAFAGVGDLRMVTDGRLKAICAEGDRGCRLYDLQRDPGERHNLGPASPARVAELREVLGAFIASVAQGERGEGDFAWSHTLARAELGDRTVAPALLPLLGHWEARVRRTAARALGQLAYAPARPVLTALAHEDPDPHVRAEAAIAGLILDEEELASDVRALVTTGGDGVGTDRRRRAALALAEHGDPGVAEPVVELLRDSEMPVALRRRGARALGHMRARAAVPALTELLDHPELRIEAADALGAIGDRRAGRALAAALETEPYLPARRAEARALATLGHPRTTELVRRWLGTPGSLPGGAAILLEVGALDRPSGAGADPRTAGRLRRGSWRCESDGCVPGQEATLVLPNAAAPRGPVRVVVLVHAPLDGAVLTLDGKPRQVRPGTRQLSFEGPPMEGPRHIRFACEGEARVAAVVVVAQRSPHARARAAGEPLEEAPPDGGVAVLP